MAPINFDKVLDSLKQGISKLAKTTVTQYAKQAEADGQAFIDCCKADLQKWTTQLAAGTLSKDDFTDLVMGQKDLCELTALKQAGLAQIALDNFKDALFNLITQTIFNLI